MKPSISLKTMFQASLGLRQKSFFLHLEAYSNCHFLLAIRLIRRRRCLASLRFWRVVSEGCLTKHLKAAFRSWMASSRVSSDSVNQSGRFLHSDAARS